MPPYPTASVINLNFPTTHEEIILNFKEHVRNNPAKPNKKRVAIIDSLVSNPGALLPWKALVDICKEEDILSLVDAAHSIGQETGLNLTESDPDFWVSVSYFILLHDVFTHTFIELPQMVICKAVLRNFIRTRKVCRSKAL